MKRLIRAHPVVIAIVIVATLLLPGARAVAVEPDPVGVWPLRPTPDVVHGFDPPADPWDAGHRGVDLAGSVGQSVHSALPGTITFVGYVAGKPVVTVSHGVTRTTYEPVSSSLPVGTAVAAGDRIGSLELAFSHCFPAGCLHWGWIRGTVYLNPIDLIEDGAVRLLPLLRDDPAARSAVSDFVSADDLRWSPPPQPYASWSPQARELRP